MVHDIDYRSNNVCAEHLHEVVCEDSRLLEDLHNHLTYGWDEDGGLEYDLTLPFATLES